MALTVSSSACKENIFVNTNSMNIKPLLTAITALMFSTSLCAQRSVTTLSDGWSIKSMLDVRKKYKGEPVTIPHTWNVEFQKGKDGQTITTAGGAPVYERGAYCYERTLDFSGHELDGKRAFLYFEGVNSVATVFVNHTPVGEHKGGYTAFCHEITGALKEGGNLVEVFCSNAWRTDVLPISGDFNVYGGMHRPCRLIITDKDCINPAYYASPGVLIHQKNITRANAEAEVEVFLSAKDRRLGVAVSVLDADGRCVAKGRKDNIDGTATSSVCVPVTVSSPRLWQGKEDPYMYRVRVELQRDGRTVDEVEQKTGFRSIAVDPQRGTFLNGQAVQVNGFCRHEDVAGRGSALLFEDYRRDMDLILESGATAMRLAHYPHGETMYDLSDEEGIILWTEIPFCGPGGMAYTGYLPSVDANAIEATRELVLQKYNHPSICFWGIFNEVLTNSGTQFRDYGDPIPLIKRINDEFHRLDKSRPTAYATCVDQRNYEGCADLIGWNKYFGWYSDATVGASEFFDKAHSMAGTVPVGVSEYGAGASPNHHLPFGLLAREQVQTAEKKGKKGSDNEAGPVGGLRSDSRFHPEEAQTYCHEGNWQVFSGRQYLWCKFVWLFADIQSYQRMEGEHDGFNDKGMLTYDRQIKKDAFYFYKAQWNKEPMAYITSRRYTQRDTAVVDIKAYTNSPCLTLYVNDKKVGKTTTDKMHRAVWTSVVLREGDNMIRIEGKASGQEVHDECVWHYGKNN